jgi:hypothetical protein
MEKAMMMDEIFAVQQRKSPMRPDVSITSVKMLAPQKRRSSNG